MNDYEPTLFDPDITDTRKPWQGKKEPSDEVKLRKAAAEQRQRTIQARFEQFHREHPEVYFTLVRITRDWRASGRTHFGISHIWEEMRWEMRGVGEKDPEHFKLSNDFRSRYARLIMAQEPDLEGFFRTRDLRSP